VSLSKHRPGPRRSRSRGFQAFLLACAVLVAWGASVRDENTLSPGFGPGYALGFVGTAFMLLLLSYSVRKRTRLGGAPGALRHWFSVHMMLGILGPVAILFHANFELGSMNSNVALVCMLLVAASGIVGRLIYPKIHHGLYGSRTSLRELRTEAASQRGELGSALAVAPQLGRGLADFESFAARDAEGLFVAVARYAGLRARAVALERLVPAGEYATAARQALSTYVGSVRRVAEFSVYERLFALWHAFHLPLCFLLFGAAIVHVIAAHLY
jgi:hypothetical protein